MPKTETPYLHIRVVPVPLYGTPLVIVISNNVKKVQERIPEFESRNNRSLFAHTLPCDWQGFQAFAAVFNPDNYFSAITHGTIAHEVHHVAAYIAEYKGLSMEHDADEAIAYLVDWIMNEIVDKFRETKVSVAKKQYRKPFTPINE